MRIHLVPIAALLLSVSCGDGPAGIECIEVVYPTSENLWYYMQGNTHVEWTGAEGESVRIDIYRYGEYFVDYLDWTPNDGYAEPPYPLDPSLHPGTYYIEITDDLGKWGIGGDFIIE